MFEFLMSMLFQGTCIGCMIVVMRWMMEASRRLQEVERELREIRHDAMSSEMLAEARSQGLVPGEVHGTYRTMPDAAEMLRLLALVEERLRRWEAPGAVEQPEAADEPSGHAAGADPLPVIVPSGLPADQAVD